MNMLAGNNGGGSTGSTEQVVEEKNVQKPDVNNPAELLKNHKERLKINGKEREYSYEELKKMASQAAASDEKFKSAKQMAEEAKQLKSAFESGDIVGALSKMGKSKKEIQTLLEDHLLNMFEEDKLDPKEKELRELKKFKEAKDAEEKANKEKTEAEKRAKAVEKARAQLEHDIVTAIEGSNLPTNTMIFQRIAREMESALLNDYEISPAEAVKIVEQDIIEEYSALLPKLGADRLKKALGKDMLKLLQEENVRSVKENTPQFAKRNSPQTKETASDDSDEKIGLEALFKGMRRRS